MAKKRGISFTRRAPDCITEELVAVLSSKAAFEFKPLFEILLLNLRERNAASGGEEMLRLRAYEKLQGLVSQGAVNREVTGATKKYKGVATRMVVLRAEMKALRADCNRRALAKAAAAN
jgi:regulator of RNase E activity RraA